jgi:hypothetical protein
MIWPWTELARLKAQLQNEESRNAHFAWRAELYQAMALKATRDLLAANKGIRRLKTRINRLEKQP